VYIIIEHLYKEKIAMADIKFFANVAGASETQIRHDLGSGLGFYGASYGVSVPISSTQDSTFVTNSNGTAVDQYAINNTKRVSTTGVIASQAGGAAGSTIDLKTVPNYYAPLRINFSHSEAVAVQNCSLKIFDRADIQKNASGVSTFVYEMRHPNQTEGDNQLDQRGVATNTWTEFDGIAGAPDSMVFTNSPGVSGFNSNTNDTANTTKWQQASDQIIGGITHRSVQHDWYLALSASPDSVGSKTYYGLYFTLEYL
jgi:hypothetical protein